MRTHTRWWLYMLFVFFILFFQAKEIFNQLYPDCEFLPRAPDPEEIVLEGDESAPGPVFEGDSGGAEDNVNKTELVDEEV